MPVQPWVEFGKLLLPADLNFTMNLFQLFLTDFYFQESLAVELIFRYHKESMGVCSIASLCLKSAYI